MIVLLGGSTAFCQTEICDNGIDDDFDNLIDLNDPDCSCALIEPVSFIPNPSFEEMDCCPVDRSQLDCATDWMQASEPTTDFIHTCNWLGWQNFPPPMPFPDGEGIMGFRDGRIIGEGNNTNYGPEPFWKEYAGACLINPLLANQTYRFQFDVGFVDDLRSPPINITFYGTSDCENLPFGIGNNAFGCPTNSLNWVKLGDRLVSGIDGDVWINTFENITPEQDIYAIAIGPACDPVFNPVSTYYFFDNLILADLESFELVVSEENHPCSPDFTISIPNNADFEYQWYQNGIALPGETNSELLMNYGEGIFQVRIIDGSTCRISVDYEYEIPIFNQQPIVSICEGDAFQLGENQLTESGSYLDTIQTGNGCDSIVSLELSVIGTRFDTVAVSILQGETYQIEEFEFTEEGDYPVTLTSSIGCDSLLFLQLSHFNIFIPNIFSPDNDGINDTFLPFGPDGEIVDYHLSIYNRWGNLLFEGKEWDGRNREPGVYTYRLDVEFAAGTSNSFFGSITLVK